MIYYEILCIENVDKHFQANNNYFHAISGKSKLNMKNEDRRLIRFSNLIIAIAIQLLYIRQCGLQK